MTRMLRIGPENFSQVVLGCFVDFERTVCVKKFDERRFPVKDRDYEDLIIGKGLLDFYFADNLV